MLQVTLGYGLVPLVLFVVGTLDIIKVVISSVDYYLGRRSVDIHDFLVTDIIIAIDIYLIAVVLLIFGLGIYRLFVSTIDESEQHGKNHPFNVQSFDELKDKIVRVVILAVIIEFFRAGVWTVPPTTAVQQHNPRIQASQPLKSPVLKWSTVLMLTL
jgi:uncharacterized membrane protein YqhA